MESIQEVEAMIVKYENLRKVNRSETCTIPLPIPRMLTILHQIYIQRGKSVNF